MNGFGFLACGGAVVLGSGALKLIPARLSRSSRSTNLSEPRSLVRVLRDEAELNDAVERAIEFERSAAHTSQQRIERYAQARSLAPLVQLAVGSELRAVRAFDAAAADPEVMVGARDTA